MDISNDSNATIILSLNDEPSDTEIENILRKYSSTSGSIGSKEGTNSQSQLYDFDNSDEDVMNAPLFKRARKNSSQNCEEINKASLDDYVNEDVNIAEFMSEEFDKRDEIFKELREKYSGSPENEKEVVILSDDSDSNISLSPTKVNIDKQPNEITYILSDDEVNEQLDKPPTANAKTKRQREIDKRRQRQAKERERKRKESENKKAMKNIEKEKKKEMMEQQKAMRNALKSVQRSTKPDECMKHMIVEIDNEIASKDYGEVLKTTLKDSNISFKAKSQVFPKLISWCRNVQTIENMLLKSTEVSEKHFLLLIDVREFSDLVRNHSLTLHIQNVSTLSQCKHLTLAIFGADKPKGDQDLAITEAQFFSKCYFRFVKENEDFARLVMEVTKAVAQIPYKSRNREKIMHHSQYFNDSNKNTVKVDKNGNGLGRLWHQMLTMFPLARLETAEAITAVYSSPASLFKAYGNCKLKKEELLQNLPIRRALGPCSTARRLGPELSKKCFNFFCATDDILL